MTTSGSCVKLPIPTNPPSQPVSDVTGKRSRAPSLAQVARGIDTAAVVPASGAVEAADVATVGFGAAGVGFLKQLQEAVACVCAVGALEDHLVDGRGRARSDGAGCCDVGCAADRGEHGGGLIAGVGAVRTGKVLVYVNVRDGALGGE